MMRRLVGGNCVQSCRHCCMEGGSGSVNPARNFWIKNVAGVLRMVIP